MFQQMVPQVDITNQTRWRIKKKSTTIFSLENTLERQTKISDMNIWSTNFFWRTAEKSLALLRKKKQRRIYWHW
jgi:REP element-mobilizing transposase RayT